MALSIFTFLYDHPEAYLVTAMAVILIACVSIAIHTAKDKIWYYITHKRNKWHCIWALFSIGTLLIMYKLNVCSVSHMLLCMLIWCAYVLTIVLSIFPKEIPSSIFLRKLQKDLDKGSALLHEHFFEQETLSRFFDMDVQIAYQVLRSSYYWQLSDYEKTYKILTTIPRQHLYDTEFATVQKNRAIALFFMDNMDSALQILGSSDDNTSNDPMVWMLYSNIVERSGDIETAITFAKKALALLETAQTTNIKTKVQVLNNYGRILLISGNEDEALRYYKQSYQIAKNVQNAKILHIASSNYIIRTATDGHNKNNATAVLEEYRNLMPTNSMENLVEYINCSLTVYRQLGDCDKELATIHDGYDTLNQLTTTLMQRESFIASTFSMLMNGNYQIGWLAPSIAPNYTHYATIPVMAKLDIFKSYMGILEQEKFKVLRQKEPFLTLYREILAYYQTDAINEIEQADQQCESVNVHQRKVIMAHKLFVLKWIERGQHIANSKKLYMNHYQTLLQAGLRLEALEAMMLYIDECGSPYNLQIQYPGWVKPQLYSEHLEQLTPPPPILDPDGIHVMYPILQHSEGLQVFPLRRTEIEEAIDIMIPQWRLLKNHPGKIEISIHIAHYLMVLDQRDKAREFYEYYKSSGVNPHLFSDWLQTEVLHLAAIFH